MRVLVTGGAGYLGSVLVESLLENGHWVRVFDRFAFGEGALGRLSQSARCEIRRGDIRRLQEAAGLLDGLDAVVHLAGLSNDPSCDLNPEMAHDVNVESTRELVNQAVQHGVRRFVLGSTCQVYGRAAFDLLDEQSPTHPVSTYGVTKLGAERAVLAAASRDFEPVVARVATMFGWSPRMRFDLAVNQMVATAVRQGVINVLGGGHQWRPFVHVRDAARAMVALLEADSERVAGDVFNVVADGANVRIRDLAELIASRFEGVRIEVARDDDDLRSYRVLGDKLCRVLGLTMERRIDDGIAELREGLADPSIDPFDDACFNVKTLRRLLATPVDDGGEPIAAHFIPLAKPCLGEEEEQAVLTAMRSGWLTSGPHVQAFERELGRLVEAPHVVAVNSCTAALHLCLVALGVQPGDEVITSPITWASTGNTILNMGARVVFADIQPDTLNIDPDAIERAVTPRTKVIMPVHLAGQPCALDAVLAVASRHGVAVVEDAAHALGAAYHGRPIGSVSDFACFSFYAIKNITTMEGGAIALKDARMAERLRQLAANGMSATAWQRYGRSAQAAPPEVVEPGYKYLMSNVGAAMGVEQLKKFAHFKATRQRLARMYLSVLPEIDEVEVPRIVDGVDHAWHLMIVRLRLDRLTKSRSEIAAALRRENIGTGVHFYGLHLHDYYQRALGMRPEDLPHATAASQSILSLPLYPGMTDRNVREVVDALKKVIAHARKTPAL